MFIDYCLLKTMIQLPQSENIVNMFKTPLNNDALFTGRENRTGINLYEWNIRSDNFAHTYIFFISVPFFRPLYWFFVFLVHLFRSCVSSNKRFFIFGFFSNCFIAFSFIISLLVTVYSVVVIMYIFFIFAVFIYFSSCCCFIIAMVSPSFFMFSISNASSSSHLPSLMIFLSYSISLLIISQSPLLFFSSTHYPTFASLLSSPSLPSLFSSHPECGRHSVTDGRLFPFSHHSLILSLALFIHWCSFLVIHCFFSTCYVHHAV